MAWTEATAGSGRERAVCRCLCIGRPWRKPCSMLIWGGSPLNLSLQTRPAPVVSLPRETCWTGGRTQPSCACCLGRLNWDFVHARWACLSCA